MKRILVVEDDADMREAFTLALEASGYVVTSAIHGRDALAKLQEGQRPDAILLDLMMPTMTGWELCETLAASAELSSIPVVVISAAGEVGTTTHASARLRKPVELKTLRATIDRVIAIAAA